MAHLKFIFKFKMMAFLFVALVKLNKYFQH